MLLAVEGGGFFSSSASGYSKGLSLLLLGQRSEDKPMRVAPWNHYQLVEQESDTQLQLASTKNYLPRGCASFVCFGRTSAGHDTPSPLKVGPAQQHDVSSGSFVSNQGKDPSTQIDNENDNRKVVLKSSLKRPRINKSVDAANEHEASDGKVADAPGAQPERRRVQWTDACGSELVEIREFEPSKRCKFVIDKFLGMALKFHKLVLYHPQFHRNFNFFLTLSPFSLAHVTSVILNTNPMGLPGEQALALCRFQKMAAPKGKHKISLVCWIEDDGSDDEFENGSGRTCSCAIM
ncbi:hypothetical protein Ahy_A09g041630 [Arachis hypogaea]|uniref:Uncharacterized protein n=1 Tax=Arachis hypogaea TaxID=3818 RepID=A0A445BDC2_ARAHY|nr:hypothetical protein Ahy_A09g041630 [Arachis hypogaea]